MNYYIGLDVSMKTTFICILDESGKIIHEGFEKTDPHLIADYLKRGLRIVYLDLKADH